MGPRGVRTAVGDSSYQPAGVEKEGGTVLKDWGGDRGKSLKDFYIEVHSLVKNKRRGKNDWKGERPGKKTGAQTARCHKGSDLRRGARKTNKQNKNH